MAQRGSAFLDKFLVFLFAVAVAGVFFAFSGSSVAQETSISSPTMCDRLNSITEEQKEQFGIVSSSCKANASGLVAHVFILGCHDCAGATYNTTSGALVNTSELNKIPTSYILRIPENWNGRVVVVIPPGNFVQTFFFPFMGTLLNEGYAVAAMNHPEPGFPGFPYEDFINPPYSTKDFRNGYLATGHLIKDLVTDVFGESVGTYGFGISTGVLQGTGILGDEGGTPFDGYILGVGGNGLLNQLMSVVESYKTNRTPLTNLTPLQTTAAQRVTILAGAVRGIGTADPEYKAFVLNGSTDEERLERALAYNASDRPKEVQRAWAALEFGSDIKKPTIFVKGLRDRVVYPGNALSHSEGIVDAGKSGLLRLYLFRNMTHGSALDSPLSPDILWVDAVHKLDAWVQNGTEPGSINAGPFGLQPSCTTMGFGTDPLACFCDIMGGVDFGGYPIPECG